MSVRQQVESLYDLCNTHLAVLSSLYAAALLSIVAIFFAYLLQSENTAHLKENILRLFTLLPQPEVQVLVGKAKQRVLAFDGLEPPAPEEQDAHSEYGEMAADLSEEQQKPLVAPNERSDVVVWAGEGTTAGSPPQPGITRANSPTSTSATPSAMLAAVVAVLHLILLGLAIACLVVSHDSCNTIEKGLLQRDRVFNQQKVVWDTVSTARQLMQNNDSAVLLQYQTYLQTFTDYYTERAMDVTSEADAVRLRNQVDAVVGSNGGLNIVMRAVAAFLQHPSALLSELSDRSTLRSDATYSPATTKDGEAARVLLESDGIRAFDKVLKLLTEEDDHLVEACPRFTASLVLHLVTTIVLLVAVICLCLPSFKAKLHDTQFPFDTFWAKASIPLCVSAFLCFAGLILLVAAKNNVEQQNDSIVARNRTLDTLTRSVATVRAFSQSLGYIEYRAHYDNEPVTPIYRSSLRGSGEQRLPPVVARAGVLAEHLAGAMYCSLEH